MQSGFKGKNRNIHYSQKVRDFRLSGEIYRKCKKLKVKIGHLSRSMQWSFLHHKLFIETKAINSGGYTTTKKSLS